MLHSGGKFSGDAYKTSGGLHGVGVSVVNALSDWLKVEVARDRHLWTQDYARGKPRTKLKDAGPVQNRRGTVDPLPSRPARFSARNVHFKPAPLYRMARAKAYLFRGVEIRWWCDPALPRPDDVPQEEPLHFPGGLSDYLASLARRPRDADATVLCRRGRVPRGRPGRMGDRLARRSRRRIARPIATPCRRPKAARTRPACAAR